MKEYKECQIFLQRCLQQLCDEKTVSERISTLGLSLNQITVAQFPGVLRSDYERLMENFRILLNRYEAGDSVVTQSLYRVFVESLLTLLIKLNEWLTLERYFCTTCHL